MTVTVLGVVVSMMGIMPLFGIMLNGLSLVNLVVCAGKMRRGEGNKPLSALMESDNMASVCLFVSLSLSPPLSSVSLHFSPLLSLLPGIAVEFTSHVARAFVAARGTRNDRMQSALNQVMLSVIFGITLTKIIGVSVLSTADSRIFYRWELPQASHAQ